MTSTQASPARRDMTGDECAEKHYREAVVERVLSRAEVLGFRVRAQQLDRASGTIAETAVLDIGVQDTGPDGGLWALANRGVHGAGPARDDLVRDERARDERADDELATVWSLRGAPHLYRRADLPAVAAAVQPFSEADAGKRIFDATKPLRAAGIGNLQALDAVAEAMRQVVTRPMVKGDVSSALAARMDAPYLRYCRPCQATHLYEQTFRLAALRAGLELQPGTSPPVMQPIPGFTGDREDSSGRYDVVRAYLRLLGPATPRQVADYLDAPVKDVRNRWPSDAEPVSVDGEARWLLAEDVADGADPPEPVVRLLGPFDLFLQARDRALLVPDPAKAKALWPVLGRPGAVLAGGEVTGLWRPRKSGSRLSLQVSLWAVPTPALTKAVQEQAERLAAHRGLRLNAVDLTGPPAAG